MDPSTPRRGTVAQADDDTGDLVVQPDRGDPAPVALTGAPERTKAGDAVAYRLQDGVAVYLNHAPKLPGARFRGHEAERPGRASSLRHLPGGGGPGSGRKP